MKIHLKKIWKEGEPIPRGYGYAWRDWDYYTKILYPIPFNLLFRLIREIIFLLKGRFVKRLDDRWFSSIKKRYYQDGYLDGYEDSQQGKENKFWK